MKDDKTRVGSGWQLDQPKDVEFEIKLLLAEYKQTNDDSRIVNVLEAVDAHTDRRVREERDRTRAICQKYVAIESNVNSDMTINLNGMDKMYSKGREHMAEEILQALSDQPKDL